MGLLRTIRNFPIKLYYSFTDKVKFKKGYDYRRMEIRSIEGYEYMAKRLMSEGWELDQDYNNINGCGRWFRRKADYTPPPFLWFEITVTDGICSVCGQLFDNSHVLRHWDQEKFKGYTIHTYTSPK